VFVRMYPGHNEDFAGSDLSQLDTWVFDQVAVRYVGGCLLSLFVCFVCFRCGMGQHDDRGGWFSCTLRLFFFISVWLVYLSAAVDEFLSHF